MTPLFVNILVNLYFSAKAVLEAERAKLRHEEEIRAHFASQNDTLESTFFIVEGHKRQSLNDKRGSLAA